MVVDRLRRVEPQAVEVELAATTAIASRAWAIGTP
jgi:hypothetical protein